VRAFGLFVCVIAVASWLPHLEGLVRWPALAGFTLLLFLFVREADRL